MAIISFFQTVEFHVYSDAALHTESTVRGVAASLAASDSLSAPFAASWSSSSHASVRQSAECHVHGSRRGI